MSFEGDILIGSGSHLPSAFVAFSEGYLVLFKFPIQSG